MRPPPRGKVFPRRVHALDARVCMPRRESGHAARGRVEPVHRWVALLALVACKPTTPIGDAPDGRDGRATPPVTWVVPPAPSGFPLGAVHGRLGRSQAPQPMVDLGISAPAGSVVGLPPLHVTMAWAVPGDGPARAV